MSCHIFQIILHVNAARRWEQRQNDENFDAHDKFLMQNLHPCHFAQWNFTDLRVFNEVKRMNRVSQKNCKRSSKRVKKPKWKETTTNTSSASSCLSTFFYIHLLNYNTFGFGSCCDRYRYKACEVKKIIASCKRNNLNPVVSDGLNLQIFSWNKLHRTQTI